MNQKLKSENYQQFGGINSKFSPYNLGPMEFLDLQNLDFQTPGSLTQRWGSTMYVSQTLPGKITALFEFSRLSGASYVIVGSSGGLWYGATTGNMQGISFLSATAMVSGNSVLPYGDFGRDSVGNPGVLTNQENAPYFGLINSQLYQYTALTIAGQTIGSNVLSFAALNNYLFACDGNQFFKFDGASTSFVGLPPMQGLVNSATVYNAAGATDLGIGATGYYGFYASYVNRRGFESQIWPIRAVTASGANSATLGGTFIQLPQFFPLPGQYDISSINVYSYWSSASLSIGQTTFWNLPYVFQANYPIASAVTIGPGSSFTFTSNLAGITYVVFNLGTTLGGLADLPKNQGRFPDTSINTYFPLGFTLMASGLSATPGGPGALLNEVRIGSYIPQFCVAHQNRLFLAGFSTTPSTVLFSDTGEPEGYPLENNFEVRTNDADVISAMQTYQGRLYIFKKNSFHVLSGDNAQNFVLQEVSNQRGAINNRCVVTFGENEQMMLLDRKGLFIWNGANGQNAAFKMQPYFDRMNYSAALTEACMIHDKLRSQVLCAIPIDGSSINNITIVYDYAAGSWTTYKGVSPSVFSRIQGRNNTQNAFYGSYSGTINWYGPSFTSDSGTGFTAYLKTRFLHDMGDSVQKQFRRLFLNIDPPSATLNINVNFFQDYGTSKVLQTTITIGEFQARIDYGISAKALCFELYNMATNSPLKIHGFTVEQRLQRKV